MTVAKGWLGQLEEIPGPAEEDGLLEGVLSHAGPLRSSAEKHYLPVCGLSS